MMGEMYVLVNKTEQNEDMKVNLAVSSFKQDTIAILPCATASRIYRTMGATPFYHFLYGKYLEMILLSYQQIESL